MTLSSTNPLNNGMLAVLLWLLPCLPCPLPAAVRVQAENRLTVSWELDDNVLEQRSGPMDGGAGALSLFSNLRFDHRQKPDFTAVSYQLGYKDYHSLSSRDSLSAGDLLVQRLIISTERRIGEQWVTGATGELKLRNIYHRNVGYLLSEEGYLRGAGRLHARRLIRGRTMLTAAYRYSFYDFETFRSFNYRAHSPSLSLTRSLGGNWLGGLEYRYTLRGYQRQAAAPDQTGDLVLRSQKQKDHFQEINASLSYARGLVLNFIYTLQRNDSNNFGFSYWNNRFSLLLGKRFAWEIFLNAYLFFELKRYSDRTDQPLLIGLITEENDNNGVILKLSRTLSGPVELSLTWSHYRNESSLRELNFHKNIVSTALAYRF